MLLLACCECNKAYGVKPEKLNDHALKVSHGICKRCETVVIERILAEEAEFKKQQKGVACYGENQ